MAQRSDMPIAHCPHCLEEVGERSHFCTACGMPITSHSTIGPMEQVWALGWLVNRLLSQPPTTFAVVGVWGLALPYLVIFMAAPFSLALAARTGHVGNMMIGVISLLVAGCYLLLAFRVTLSYLRRPRRVARDP
jgi:hypothetical protein